MDVTVAARSPMPVPPVGVASLGVPACRVAEALSEVAPALRAAFLEDFNARAARDALEWRGKNADDDAMMDEDEGGNAVDASAASYGRALESERLERDWRAAAARFEAAHRELRARLESALRNDPTSSATAFLNASMLEASWKDDDEAPLVRLQQTARAWRQVKDTAAAGSARRNYAQLELARDLVARRDFEGARGELADLCGSSLAWARGDELFEIGEVAEATGDFARAIAAFRVSARASRAVAFDGSVATRELHADTEAGRYDDVVPLAITIVATLPPADGLFDYGRHLVRREAANAIAHLGSPALARLDGAPPVDAEAIAVLVANDAEATGDLPLAAAAAARGREMERADALRRRSLAPLDERAALRRAVADCFEYPRREESVELDIRVERQTDGSFDVTTAPEWRSECLAREARLRFSRARRDVHAHVLVHIAPPERGTAAPDD